MTDSVPRTEKRCPKCNTVKPVSDFYPSATDDRLATCCKKCANIARSERYREKFPDGHKRCSYCREIKPFDQFFKSKQAKDGHGYECKTCYQERFSQLVEIAPPPSDGKRKPYAHRAKETLPEGHKRCLMCEEVKPAKEFYTRKGNRDGLTSYCKPCWRTREYKSASFPKSKQCSLCGEIKSASEFYMRNGRRRKGLRSECKECSKANVALYPYSVVKEKRSHLRSIYGITLEEYTALLEEQDGKCATCGNPETLIINGKTVFLAVDHDHKTGKVRGLLCSRCNQALGLLLDDPERIEALLRYVRKTPC